MWTGSLRMNARTSPRVSSFLPLGQRSSVSCLAHQKSAEDRNHLPRRKLARGRALCGAHLRNVRSVLCALSWCHKIARWSPCVTSLASRSDLQPMVRDAGIVGMVMIKISRSNSRNGVLCLQLARQRARQPTGGSNGHALKRMGLLMDMPSNDWVC